MRRLVLLTAWTAALVAVLAAALRLGSLDALAAPPLRPSGWGAWIDARAPAQAFVALGRLVVVGLTAYLLVVTLLAVVRLPVLPTPAFVRWLAGAALASGLLVAPASASPAPTLRMIDRPATPPPIAAPAPAAVGEWVVGPGDHLWRVAESTVSSRLGRTATDAEVAPYWRRVVAANRDRVPDPDLVHPGQRLVLPE